MDRKRRVHGCPSYRWISIVCHGQHGGSSSRDNTWLHCLAGCSNEDVLSAIGLNISDLEDKGTQHG